MSKPRTNQARPELTRGLSLDMATVGRPLLEKSRDPKFDDAWWNTHQAVVWLALGNRDAVDMVGREPGEHVLAMIDNTPGDHMSAVKAHDKIGAALADGRIGCVRLLDGADPVPVALHEWAAVKVKKFDLSPGAPMGWWLNYRLRRDDVIKLTQAAGGEGVVAEVNAADVVARIRPKKKRKITGRERFIAALVALHKAGTDMSDKSDNDLCRLALDYMGKTGREPGLSYRTFERALAEWKVSAQAGQ